MLKIIIPFLTAGVTFTILDYIWLAKIMKDYYLEKLTPFVEIKNNSLVVNYYGAAAFYVLALFTIYFFVVKNANSNIDALLTGALLGFCMYGFYDFTNYATLKNWPLSLTVVDIAWGTFLVGAVSLVMYYTRSLL
jgi:uncharacterized membrane protein